MFISEKLVQLNKFKKVLKNLNNIVNLTNLKEGLHSLIKLITRCLFSTLIIRARGSSLPILVRADAMEVGVSASVSRVLSEININTTALTSSFTPQVIHFAKDSHGRNRGSVLLSKRLVDFCDRIFILDGKACQIHVFSQDDSVRKKTFFLTPQPSSYPMSMLISPDRNFLAILTETSAHVVDVSKTDSLLRSKQVCTFQPLL